MSDIENEEVAFGGTVRKDRKARYRKTLIQYLNEFKHLLVIKVDNVGSSQMQETRQKLRGRAAILMGKNTVMRKVLREEGVKNPKILGLLPYIVGNIGFVFTNGDLTQLRNEVISNKVPAAARAGQIAPADCFIPPGPTPLDPGQTSFFQALNIATKVTKGAIEILTQVHLIIKNERVTSSAVSLLNKLALKPFFYSIVVEAVYEDGDVYSSDVLDMDDAQLIAKFAAGVQKLAAISLAIGYPNQASIPHSFNNALKLLVSISLATAFSFEEAKTFKMYLENPDLLAAAKASAAPAAKAAGAPAAKAAAPVEEEEEEAPAMDLFGGGGKSDY